MLVVWGFSEVFQKQPVYLAVSQLHRYFQNVAWTCIVSLDQETDAVILGSIGKARLIEFVDHLQRWSSPFQEDGCQL